MPRAPTQFRFLYRHFLSRLIEPEALSIHAEGSADKFLGQLASLLIFLSVLFSIPTLGVGGIASQRTQLVVEWTLEHFLIATTMLVIGVLSVLSWETLLPDRRDIYSLNSLPIRARTIFAAKTAASAAGLGLAVVSLHCIAGVLWPFALNGREQVPFMPTMTAAPGLAPAQGEELERILATDLEPAVSAGVLSPDGALGLVIGITESGARRILTFGSASPDSVFEIGSITKPFTALLLADAVGRGELDLDETLGDILSAASDSADIRLVDLATHRAGLLPMPRGFVRRATGDPYVNYGPAELRHHIAGGYLRRLDPPAFRYSNLGYSILGLAVVDRAGAPYEDLLAARVLAPLGMADTAITLRLDQSARLIQGYDVVRQPVQAWDLNAFRPAGGIRSTATDMLTFLEANLAAHGAPPGAEPLAQAMAQAMAQTHQLQAEAPGDNHIALGWLRNDDSGFYWHNGATGGYSSHAFFSPSEDYAAVVLTNSRPGAPVSADVIGPHVEARMAGKPTVSIGETTIPARSGLAGLARLFLAYWVTMLFAGTFVFCCILALQGLATLCLPRRVFLALSPVLQIGVFCLLVILYFLPRSGISPVAIVEAQQGGLAYWTPSYWFLGVFQAISGSPMFAPLAERGWTALSVVLGLTALTYFPSYARTLHQILEQPEGSPRAARAALPIVLVGERTKAIVRFAERTMVRSPAHRGIAAFYIGVAFAVTIYFVRMPFVEELSQAAATDTWSQPSIPLVGSTFLVLALTVLGVRSSFVVPKELPASWTFRVTPVPGGSRLTRAYRQALLRLAVLPVLAIVGVLLFILWPWKAALAHLAILGLTGITLVELALPAPRIPYACSYLPGRSNLHITFWLCMLAIMNLIARVAEFEIGALSEPLTLAAILLLLGIAAVVARARTRSRSRETAVPDFETVPDDGVVELKLSGASDAQR